MQQRSEETRARILSAALNQFATQGYDAASVDEICAEAEISKGAFYHHFESKQALFLALLDDWLAEVDSGLNSLRKHSVPKTLLHMTEILPAILATAGNRLPMFLEFWLQASRDEQVRKASLQPYRHYRDQFAGLIEEGISQGTLKNVDPNVAGQLILSMAVGLLLQGLLDPKGADWEKTGRESMRIIMKGIEK